MVGFLATLAGLALGAVVVALVWFVSDWLNR